VKRELPSTFLLRSKRWVRLLDFWVLETCLGGLNSGVRWKKVDFWVGVAGDDGGASAGRHLRRWRKQVRSERTSLREREAEIEKWIKIDRLGIYTLLPVGFPLSVMFYILLMLLCNRSALLAHLVRQLVPVIEGAGSNLVDAFSPIFPPFFLLFCLDLGL
jgi:hypothetical protein